MKNLSGTLIILCLITLISCTNNEVNQEQKQTNDTALIHRFFEINNTQNVIEASNMFLNKANFRSLVKYENKLVDSNIEGYFVTLKQSDEEMSYPDMLHNLYEYFNHREEDIINIIIDSIQIDSFRYRVFQSVNSPVFKDFNIPLPGKIEDFYIEQDTITKVVLQSINIPDVTNEFKEEMTYWIHKFTNKETVDYHSLLLGINNDEFHKSVIENYKKFKSFEETLMNKYQYHSHYSLKELHQEAWLTDKLEDVAVKLYIKFERIELYFDPVLQSENDTTQLVHLYFSDKRRTEISGVTRIQDSTAFAHLKPKQMCAVYGLGAKNLVGELQLKDVVIYSYPQNNQHPAEQE